LKLRLSTQNLFLLFLIVAVTVAACDSNLPPPPLITVEITVVSDTQALEQAVAEALGATEQAGMALTATIDAQGGITYTPSPTATPSRTPTATPTRFVTPTRTPLPTDTVTPTYAPYLTNTPAPSADEISWVRVLHAWQPLSQTSFDTDVDVYINEERVTRALEIGGQTTYLQLAPGQIRLTLRDVDASVTTPTPLLLNAVVDVPSGAALSLVLTDQGNGLELLPVTENLTPVASGFSRLTVIQTNPELLPVDLVLTDDKRTLATDLDGGEIVGPVEIPSKSYLIDGYEAGQPAQVLFTLDRINLVSRLNYLLVMMPFRGEGQRLTNSLLFTGNTRLIDTDLNARFVNFAPDSGPLVVNVDGNTLFADMAVGEVSDTIPISASGSNLLVANTDGVLLYEGLLGPWTADNERSTDKIVLFGDANTPDGDPIVTVNPISQNAPRSAINANLRLIHALPGGASLSLEILRTTAIQGENAPTWIPITQAGAGTSSAFVPRAPEILDVRVVQTGTRNVIAQRSGVQLLPGGAYDFLVVPGAETGSARLEMLQPVVQFTSLAIERGDPTAIAEAVQATLTAQAPDISPTPTSANTATPTPTPVATNTPRPTNTPNVLPPLILVDPAAPNAASGNFTLVGQNFTPGRRYSVRLDVETRDLARGTVADDGTLVISVRIPADVTPGPHTIQVCVDCRAGGINQAQYAPLVVANPSVTPTATPRP
jgi:hypothetical protein